MLTRTASGVSSASIIWARVDLPAPGAPVIPRKLRCPGVINRRAAVISSGRLSVRSLMASTLTLQTLPVSPRGVATLPRGHPPGTWRFGRRYRHAHDPRYGREDGH